MSDSKMKSLLLHRLNACHGAIACLAGAKVNRETWETHPYLKNRPENLFWLAISVGVDLRWIAAATVWFIYPMTPVDKTSWYWKDLVTLARWSQAPIGTPFPYYERFYQTDPVRDFVKLARQIGRDFPGIPRYWGVNDFTVTLQTWFGQRNCWDRNRIHADVLKVLTWDVVKSAMIEHGLGEYLDE